MVRHIDVIEERFKLWFENDISKAGGVQDLQIYAEPDKGECYSLSYDVLTVHVAIALMQYMLLAMEQCQNEDQRMP